MFAACLPFVCCSGGALKERIISCARGCFYDGALGCADAWKQKPMKTGRKSKCRMLGRELENQYQMALEGVKRSARDAIKELSETIHIAEDVSEQPVPAAAPAAKKAAQ